jgi:hypothetical protein
VDALVADRYLEHLLAGGDRVDRGSPGDGGNRDDRGSIGNRGTPGSRDEAAGAALDPGLRDAARVLRRTLVRVHPSFRFEERLAARLADLAAAQARPALAAAGGGSVIPFPTGGRRGRRDPDRRAGAEDALLDAVLRGDLDPADGAAVERAAVIPFDRRPLIVGGTVITSAAISIVGVAIVAWRATRPTGRAAAGADLTGSA